VKEILLVTQADDLAADLVVLALEELGAGVVRFNAEEFPSRTSLVFTPSQDPALLVVNGRETSLDEIGTAWYRKSAPPRVDEVGDQGAREFVARESAAFLYGFWESVECPWMNRPSRVHHAENKLIQLRHAWRVGLEVPDTCITNLTREATGFVRGRPCVAKPVVGGVLRHDGRRYRLFTRLVGEADLSDPDSVRLSPLTLQRYVSRRSDLRVTVVGHEVFATEIFIADREPEEVDWRQVDELRLSYRPHELPRPIEAACVEILESFGLRYGAFDFLLTPDGSYVFLELNPSGQWDWIERATGQQITSSMARRLADDVRSHS
jgi:glutathione synthase/RimK-type ligase-like ATP-grasp enzyme